MNRRLHYSLAGILALSLLTTLATGCNGKAQQVGDKKEDASGKPEENEADSGVRQWASKQWNNAISSGTQTAEGTGEWVTKLYESAKQAGTTSATSATDWVKEDWSAQGDWEYQIVQLDSSDIPAVQKALNESGRSRWDCYHVERTDKQWTFFMKRKRHSYLSKLPLRELTTILPFGLGAGDEE